MLPLVLAVRFVLELTLLAVFGWWGFTLGGGGPAGWAVGALSAAGIAVLWGLLLSPKARIALPPARRNVLEVAVFLLAAGTLAAHGHLLWGVLLVAADVLVLFALWRLHANTAGEPVG
jgi:hypothetical protein